MSRKFFGAVTILLLTCASVFAQGTNGTISGRVVDEQGAAVPGATVTAKSAATGFTRSEVSDTEGVYRLSALPVGIYDVTAELQGFTTVSKKAVEVNVGQNQNVDFPLKVAQLAETVNVTGATPLIQTTASSVGSVVDVKRIETMPLNGRQFANLAATVPGVGLSFHSDPTKSTQYAPLVNGGAGRNINYQIDGGDNNDDTVGGPLAAVSARGDRAVQLPDAALQGGVRPQQRRRAERRHQERHQPVDGQRLRVLPRQVDERADRDRDPRRHRPAARRPRATTAATSSAAASAVRF